MLPAVPEDVTLTTLPNGLTVIVREDHSAPVVSAQAREAYPDRTAFDPKDDHYDPDSKPDAPRWFAVDVQLVRKLDAVITLDELRSHVGGKLRDMIVLKRGNRLSVTPVTKAEWEFIESLAARRRKAQ